MNPLRTYRLGDFLDENGNRTTDIEKFESVKISNHKFLYTPHMDRWILPPVPSQKKTEEGRSIWKEVLGGLLAAVSGPLGLVIGIGTPIAGV